MEEFKSKDEIDALNQMKFYLEKEKDPQEPNESILHTYDDDIL